jgi:hypothetical protein
MSKVARVLAGFAVLVGLVVGTPLPAQASVTPPSGTWVELFAPYEDPTLCLDVPSGSSTAGLRLQMYHCHGYASNGGPQRWVFVHISDGSYQIENWANHLCVTAEVQASSNPRYGYIVQLPCDLYRGQEWTLVPHPDNPDLLFQLSNVNYDNECMWASPSSSSWVIWTNCNSTIPDQVWELG